MRDLDGKCGDGVEIMIVKNIPSSFILSFFFLKEDMWKHFKMIVTLTVK